MQSMKLFWGLTILALGLVFIGVNQGWIGSSVWLSILALWPILLIVIGLNLLIKDEKILSLLIILIVLASTIFVALTYNRNNTFWENRGELMGIKINNNAVNESLNDQYDLALAQNLDVSLSTGAAKVKIGVLPAGTSAGELYSVTTKDMGKLSVKKTISGDRINLAINEENVGFNFGPSMMTDREVELYLTKDLVLNLKLEGGASKLDLDFSDLQVESLDLNIGASTANITFGERGARQDVKLSAGASSLHFYIPNDVGIEATFAGGLNTVESDSILDIIKNGDSYTSKAFDTAKTKIEISGSAGVSNIKFSVK